MTPCPGRQAGLPGRHLHHQLRQPPPTPTSYPMPDITYAVVSTAPQKAGQATAIKDLLTKSGDLLARVEPASGLCTASRRSVPGRPDRHLPRLRGQAADPRPSRPAPVGDRRADHRRRRGRPRRRRDRRSGSDRTRPLSNLGDQQGRGGSDGQAKRSTDGSSSAARLGGRRRPASPCSLSTRRPGISCRSCWCWRLLCLIAGPLLYFLPAYRRRRTARRRIGVSVRQHEPVRNHHRSAGLRSEERVAYGSPPPAVDGYGSDRRTGAGRGPRGRRRARRRPAGSSASPISIRPTWGRWPPPPSSESGLLIVLFVVYLFAFTPLTASRNQQRLAQTFDGQPLKRLQAGRRSPSSRGPAGGRPDHPRPRPLADRRPGDQRGRSHERAGTDARYRAPRRAGELGHRRPAGDLRRPLRLARHRCVRAIGSTSSTGPGRSPTW